MLDKITYCWPAGRNELLHKHFLLIAFIDILVGGYVFFKSPKKQTHIAFGVLTLNFALWNCALFLLLNSQTHFQTIILLLGRLAFTAGMLAPAALLHFAMAFPNKSIYLKEMLLLYIPGGVAFLLTLTPLVIKDVKVQSWGLEPVIGPGYLFVILYFALFIGLAIYWIIKEYRNAAGISKLQWLYILFGLPIPILHVLLTNIILPLLGLKEIYVLGPWATVEMVGLFGYAILRYRLLDIEIIIKRTTVYFGLVIIITSIYTFVILIPQQFILNAGNSRPIIFIIIAAVISAITMVPLRDWLDSVTDRVFFQRKYDYYLVLEKLARELNSVLKLSEILNVVSATLLNEMHLRNVGIYLRERSDTTIYLCHTKDGETADLLPEQIGEGNPLLEYLLEKRQLIETGEFRHQYGHLYSDGKIADENKYQIQKELDKTFQAALIIPLIQKKNLMGFMALGEKKSGDLFTSRDLSLLETLSSQMTTALENVHLYDQMIANERLTVIGTLAAGIAHEIRNPLASIKTFIQMLPEKYNQEDFRTRFHTVVGSEIDRLSTITADLLTFARPSAPKLDTLNMDYLMDKVKTLMASPFRKKQIEFSWNLAHLPNIQADPQQIFQIVLNIVINSVHASHEKGQIKVYGEIKDQAPGHPSGKGLYMLVTIEDFGTGIKRKDMVNLFQPFFTTKTEGTGLGLATCKRILEAHRGDIYIESEEGKGTKVTIMLPTNLTQDAVIIPIAAPIRKFE